MRPTSLRVSTFPRALRAGQWTTRAAETMSLVPAVGLEISDTSDARTSTMRALARSANNHCCAGWMTRSWVPTRCRGRNSPSRRLSGQGEAHPTSQRASSGSRAHQVLHSHTIDRKSSGLPYNNWPAVPFPAATTPSVHGCLSWSTARARKFEERCCDLMGREIRCRVGSGSSVGRLRKASPSWSRSLRREIALSRRPADGAVGVLGDDKLVNDADPRLDE